MHKLIILACLALAACAAPVARQVSTYRKMDAPIWSNAQLDAARLPGRWVQSAGFAAAPGRCTPGPVVIDGAAGTLGIDAGLCLGGQLTRISGPMQATGPGRFAVAGQDWWVIWVDTDYRSLAIGTPKGDFGFILNRNGPLPPDRLRAATEIFDFNGYDRSRLHPF